MCLSEIKIGTSILISMLKERCCVPDGHYIVESKFRPAYSKDVTVAKVFRGVHELD
jgi:hypothetical protein